MTAVPLAGTSVIASYAYTDARVVGIGANVGKRLANVARHSGSLWLRHQAGRWTLGAGLFAQGQREGDVRNTFELPGYVRGDAMLAWHGRVADGRLTVQLNVDNVADKRYYLASHQFVSDWIRPAAGRLLRTTLRFEG